MLWDTHLCRDAGWLQCCHERAGAEPSALVRQAISTGLQKVGDRPSVQEGEGKKTDSTAMRPMRTTLKGRSDACT